MGTTSRHEGRTWLASHQQHVHQQPQDPACSTISLNHLRPHINTHLSEDSQICDEGRHRLHPKRNPNQLGTNFSGHLEVPPRLMSLSNSVSRWKLLHTASLAVSSSPHDQFLSPVPNRLFSSPKTSMGALEHPYQSDAPTPSRVFSPPSVLMEMHLS